MTESPAGPVPNSMKPRNPAPLHVDTGLRSAPCTSTHAQADTLDPGSSIPSPGPADYLPLSPMNTFFPPVLPPASERLPADTLPPLHEVFASTTFFPSASGPVDTLPAPPYPPAPPRPIATLPSAHISAHALPPSDLAHAHAPSKSAPFPFTFKARIPQHPHAVPHVRVLEPPGDPFYTHRFRVHFPPPPGQLEWGWTPRPMGLMRRWAWGRGGEPVGLQENENTAGEGGLSAGSVEAQVQAHADDPPPYAAFASQAPAPSHSHWQPTATVHALHPLQIYPGPKPHHAPQVEVDVDTDEASFAHRFPPLESIHPIHPSMHPRRPVPAVSTALADRSSALFRRTPARTSSTSPPRLAGAPSSRLGPTSSSSPPGNTPSPRLGFTASLSRFLGLRPSPPRQTPTVLYGHPHPYRGGAPVRQRTPGPKNKVAAETNEDGGDAGREHPRPLRHTHAGLRPRQTPTMPYDHLHPSRGGVPVRRRTPRPKTKKVAAETSEDGDDVGREHARASPSRHTAHVHRSATLPPAYTPEPQPTGTTSPLPERAPWNTSAPAPASASASGSSSSAPTMLPLSPVPFVKRNVRRRCEDQGKEKARADDEDGGVEGDENPDRKAGNA
ncbi:hypothetical protein C8R45DRAFT_1220503 [Mycena sanguinolenta]|nr:hypothetical protein C8R45DRAFT_1220503 [Mycena sanguinolenta]